MDWTPDDLFTRLKTETERLGLATTQVKRALSEGFYVEAMSLTAQQITSGLRVLIYVELGAQGVDLHDSPQLEKLLSNKRGHPGDERRVLQWALVLRAIPEDLYVQVAHFFDRRNDAMHKFLSADYSDVELKGAAQEGRKLIT